MSFFVAALLLLLISAIAALACSGKPGWAAYIGAGGNVAAALLGVTALFFGGGQLALPLSLPGAQFHIALDPLSSLFLAPMFLLCACAAVYAVKYSGLNRATGVSFFLFNLLTASMGLVFTARNAVLFLVVWELMTIFSFLLVVTDYGNAETRRAGWIYLVATHIGTAFLLALFALAWHKCGSADFDAFPAAFAAMPFSAIAAMTLVGFGTKAGFFPLHVWLPKAHPAAPSHVSAVMSGIMIKTGIYGILRIMLLCPQPPFWFGALLAGVGLVSAVAGIIFALAQHDIKILLAYSSVENIGIIALGLGIGYMGLASGSPLIAFLGFAGGLLHAVNHSFFKGLLFLCAGAVHHATGVRDMNRLGGLRRFMPATWIFFLCGSLAACALPPFNGLMSEFLIFSGAFKAVALPGLPGLAGLVALTGLAFAGGLAAACFTGAAGSMFLGEARVKFNTNPHEPAKSMLWSMFALAMFCLLIGLLPQLAAPLVNPAAALLCGTASFDIAARLQPVGFMAFAVVLAAVLLWFARVLLLKGRSVTAAATWGCGYTAPSAKIQYTPSSFFQPLVDMLGAGTEKVIEKPRGLFPKTASFRSDSPDLAKTRLYRPLFAWIEERLCLLHNIQQGSIHAYILYLAGALVALLIWSLR